MAGLAAGPRLKLGEIPMSFIDETWIEAAYVALEETLRVDKHVRKQMIEYLVEEGFWSRDMDWDKLEAKWSANINRNRSEFFKVGELWALMRRFGRHHFFLALAQDLGYYCVPMPTEARKQALLERLAAAEERAANEIAAARAELQRLEAQEQGKDPQRRPGAMPMFCLPKTAVEAQGCP